MAEDSIITRCLKFENMTCPFMDRPEMQKIESGESAGSFDPIAYWENIKKANDKFCVTCDEFEPW